MKAKATNPVFAPRHLTREEVVTLFTNAMREIETRLLCGHINHVIDPEREGHYDEDGAHAQGEKILGALNAALEDSLKAFDRTA